MGRLLEHVEKSIAARKLLARGGRLLVAVSGGVDSMVLLRLLHDLASKRGWRLTVAHFNHRLRGRSSGADERLVRATAKNLGLPFAGGSADVRQFARAEKLSLEMAARKLRHGFLARTARRRNISVVALAHHADDQVELFFLRLLRGSGGEGLAGMKWSGASPANARVTLVRPLLDTGKAELEAFAREYEIPFRADASNRSLDFLRNRVRHELLPLLRRRYQPALDKTVLRAMEIVGAESEFVSAAALQSEGRVPRVPKSKRKAGLVELVPPKCGFARQPVAVQRRILQRQLLERGIAPDFDLIERLRKEADCGVTISPQVNIWRDAAGIVRLVGRVTPFAPASGFERAAGRGLPALPAASAKVDLKKNGAAAFGGARISWNIEQRAGLLRPKPVAGREFFDADRVGSPIVLRHWRAGDRFQPIGMSAPVKLQDLFVNARIPRERRHELALAEAGGEIFWVEGLRIGGRFRLTPQTRRRLAWRWRRV